MNREVANGNPTSETLGSERKTLPGFEGQLLVVRIYYEIFVPVAKETTLEVQGQRLVYSAYINFLA